MLRWGRVLETFLKWLDRFGLVITLITFSLVVLEYAGAYSLPDLRFGDGRFLFIGLLIYQAVLAAAASVIGWFFYARFRASGLGTIVAVGVWSFINVSVVDNILGADAWNFGDATWSQPTGLNFAGMLWFWVCYYFMFASKASAHQGEEQGGFFFASTVRQYSKLKLLGLLYLSTIGWHAGWRALDAMQL